MVTRTYNAASLTQTNRQTGMKGERLKRDKTRSVDRQTDRHLTPGGGSEVHRTVMRSSVSDYLFYKRHHVVVERHHRGQQGMMLLF